MATTLSLGSYWRWYADADPPSSPLGDENVKPTLADENIIRLRLQIEETGGTDGSGTMDIEYREGAGGTWTNVGAAAHWQMANGASTEGGLLSISLTGSNFAQVYIETTSYSASVKKSKVNEFDLALQPVNGNYTPATDYYFRVNTVGADTVSGAEYPVVTTPSASTPGNAYPSGVDSTASSGTAVATGEKNGNAIPSGVSSSSAAGAATLQADSQVSPSGVDGTSDLGTATAQGGGRVSA